MILPQTPYAVTQSIAEMPSRTYRYDPSSKRIIGKVDGVDACVQAYSKMFDTERFAYEIYTQEYGVEFRGLLGKDREFARAVLPARIAEALFTDDRTVRIEELTITAISIDTLDVFCRVVTTQGTVTLRKELRF